MDRIQRRRWHLALVVLIIAAGCSKADAPPTDSAAAAGASPPAASAPATPAPAASMPGALTKPIEQYAGDELYDFVRKLAFSGGQERDRRCKNSPDCNGAKRIKVRVDAVTAQDSIAPSNATQFGVVYARALNKGDAEEARYSLPPGNKFEYYLIVSADGAGGMRWRIEQLDTTPGARTHAQVGSGSYVGCNHAWRAGARADFKTCAQAASVRDSLVRLGLVLQGGGGDDPLWTECAAGCCVAT